MAKTNFTKVEDALADGLQKLNIEQLLETVGRKADKLPKELRQLHLSFQYQLRWLIKHDKAIHKKIDATQEEINHFLKVESEKLSKDEWKRIQALHAACHKIKQAAVASDDDLVDKERQKHRHKRFNISDKWLPLK